jgi:hypothetical protein
MMARKAKQVNYVDNVKFQADILEFRKRCEEAGRNLPIPNHIAKPILDIATNMARSAKFYKINYKEDMIGDAVEDCIRGFFNYDPARGNPFAYFTQCCFYAFISRIKTERTQDYARHKLRRSIAAESFTMDENSDMEGVDFAPSSDSSNVDAFIEQFEKNLEDRRARARENKIARERRGLEVLLEEGDE